MKKERVSPLFIVSSGRAGTTLLRGILNATDQIYIPYESDFLARAYRVFQDKELTQEDYSLAVSTFMIASEAQGWGMDKDYLLSYLHQHQPKNFKELNSRIYEAYLDQNGHHSLPWGIKHPVLIANIAQIFQVFPDANIIHVVRDGRDVYLSYKQVHEREGVSFGPNGIFQAALYWIDGLRRINDTSLSADYEKQLYNLRYEDLISHPEQSLQDVCQFIGIEYSESMHQNYQTSQANTDLLLKSHQKSIHTKIMDGIDKDNSNKFLDKMSREDRILFEIVSSPFLEKYGYLVEFPFSKLFVFELVRFPTYLFARIFNNLRYYFRDRKVYKKALATDHHQP